MVSLLQTCTLMIVPVNVRIRCFSSSTLSLVLLGLPDFARRGLDATCRSVVGACFLANGVSYFAIIVALIAIRSSDLMEESLTTKTAGRAMREGFNYVWHTPHARLLTTNIAVFSVFTLPMMVLMPVVAERFGPMVAIGSGGVVMLLSAVRTALSPVLRQTR